MTEINYIEDLLQVVLGKYGHTFALRDADLTLLNSFDRQICKGVALTDRQFNLLKIKLEVYGSQFKKNEIRNWQAALQNCSTEFREIDRTKSIEIVDYDKIVKNTRTHWSLKEGRYIKVRFPFNKKFIAKLENIIYLNNNKSYFHEKNSHEHYFRFTPINCHKIRTAFPEWQTDKEVIEVAGKVQEILDNKEDYIPQYKNNKFINVDEKTTSLLESKDKINIADASIAYGFFINESTNNTLLDTIAYRKEPTVLANIDIYSLYDIVDCLDHLDRYPLLVCVDKDDAFKQVQEMHSAITKFVPCNLQSVMFRVESSDKENNPLNNFVKENSLNNWVDQNTKVVYIKKDKLPKVLLKSDFKPRTAVCKSSLRSNRLVTNYVSYNCDLIVYNDTDLSSFRTHYNKGFNGWQVVN
jgi:hypothetical protein|tara:strand:+ start:827 stop:2059 length:1233 start_codon:yes stop_codon:yes gene_type:complete